jgi:cyclic pyranopterin phosphate synthase
MLIDKYLREINYLRVSLTENCNYNCLYCKPVKIINQHNNILPFEIFVRLIRIFVNLGVTKIRLTGGEPLLRNGIIEFLYNISNIENLKSIGITTNGSLLTKYANNLRKVNITNLNVSLDTLNREKFKKITGKDELDLVLDGIKLAKNLKFENLKINTVIINGINKDEILDFVKFSIDNSINIRFIEVMPAVRNFWNKNLVVSYEEIKKIITQSGFKLIRKIIEPYSTSKDYIVEGYGAKIGFISGVSNKLCSNCNRLRLTSDAKLKICLHDKYEIDLAKEIYENKQDTEIADLIKKAICIKKSEAHISPESAPTMWKVGG